MSLKYRKEIKLIFHRSSADSSKLSLTIKTGLDRRHDLLCEHYS
jgi:hypothetical protein